MKDNIKVSLRLDVPTVETTSQIDGFEVEELIRNGFEIPDDYAGDLTIGYNDFINYTKNIIGLTMESIVRVSSKNKFNEEN